MDEVRRGLHLVISDALVITAIAGLLFVAALAVHFRHPGTPINQRASATQAAAYGYPANVSLATVRNACLSEAAATHAQAQSQLLNTSANASDQQYSTTREDCYVQYSS